MYVVAVNHDVEDFDAWKKVFDEFSPARGGATFHRVNRRVGSPDNVTVVAGFESTEAAQAFLDNPDLKDAMQRAGVVGEPRFELYEEVEVVIY